MKDKTKTTTISLDLEDKDIEFALHQSPPTNSSDKIANRAGTNSIVKGSKVLAEKEKRLKLEKVEYNSHASRGEMYKKMLKEENRLFQDVYDFPTPFSRGVALLFDLGFYALMFKVSKFLAPFEILLVDFALAKYKYQSDLSVDMQNILYTLATLVFFIFFFVIIPLSFFNTSFGKKIMGIRVRGIDRYTMTISQVFLREIILKPFSIAILVGFVMPFFTKHKQSFHDKMADTFVVKD